MLSIVVARAKNAVIGNSSGGIPWAGKLPSDSKRLREVIKGHRILGSDKTLSEMKSNYGELGRIILSRNPLSIQGQVINSIDEARKFANTDEEIVIIGGGSVFAQLIQYTSKIYLTEIDYEAEGDVYFPELDMSEWDIVETKSHKKGKNNLFDYKFSTLVRKNRQ